MRKEFRLKNVVEHFTVIIPRNYAKSHEIISDNRTFRNCGLRLHTLMDLRNPIAPFFRYYYYERKVVRRKGYVDDSFVERTFCALFYMISSPKICFLIFMFTLLFPRILDFFFLIFNFD